MSNTGIKVEGATGSKSKEGVVQWVVPYYVTNIEQVLTAGEKEYQGSQEVSRTWSCNNDGPDPSYIVTVVYEGGDQGSGGSGSGTYGDDDSALWSLDFEMSEEPIESHWNFETIKKKYGGRWTDPDNKEGWKFDETMPAGSGSSSGLGGKSKSGAGDKNPMFGVTTYIVMTAVVSVSYTNKTLPRSVINGIGKLYKSIPGAPDQIDSLDKGAHPTKLIASTKVPATG